jgi:hypothetical protein
MDMKWCSVRKFEKSKEAWLTVDKANILYDVARSIRKKQEASLVLCAPKLLYNSYKNKKQEAMLVCLPDPSNQL